MDLRTRTLVSHETETVRGSNNQENVENGHSFFSIHNRWWRSLISCADACNKPLFLLFVAMSYMLFVCFIVCIVKGDHERLVAVLQTTAALACNTNRGEQAPYPLNVICKALLNDYTQKYQCFHEQNVTACN